MSKKHDFEDVTVKSLPKTKGKKLKIKKPQGIFAASGEKIQTQRTMRFWFTFAIFILFAITGITTALLFLLFDLIASFNGLKIDGYLLVISMALACILIGAGLAALSGKYIMSRISRISHGMREVARGNFKERVPEKDKKNSPTEFGELERSFNQMASDLDGIEIFRNDFINDFSHEFKTPIVSIRGFARQLQSENLSEEQKNEYVNIIISESERLVNMSSNVLLLSKLENQQIVSDKHELDLDEQIRRSILLLEKDWSEKEIDLDIDLDEIKINFNEEMLSHVWINLISNAIKFTEVGGRIEISLKEREGMAIFSIKDNGIGMSDEVKERIFEKFYQGDRSHTTSGNGIGLNIVQRIISLARGAISVESTLGEGSKFTVTIPI
jgi:signal transduction histidine kinase